MRCAETETLGGKTWSLRKVAERRVNSDAALVWESFTETLVSLDAVLGLHFPTLSYIVHITLKFSSFSYSREKQEEHISIA